MGAALERAQEKVRDIGAADEKSASRQVIFGDAIAAGDAAVGEARRPRDRPVEIARNDPTITALLGRYRSLQTCPDPSTIVPAGNFSFG